MRNLLSVIGFILLFWVGAPAGMAGQRPTIFEKLTEVEGAEMTLAVDVAEMLGNRKSAKYFPAVLTTSGGDTYKVKLRVRGRFRRMKCGVPPFKIEFQKPKLVASGLDTLDNIKVTIPCLEQNNGNELVVKEYLAYRMFEHLTPQSVRARLVKLTLKDTGADKKEDLDWTCIFIEDDDEVARRLNSTVIDHFGLPADTLEQTQYALTAMFQYFVGNTDWDYAMHRNVHVVQPKAGGKALAIPYDFDFSGLVSAPYASPSVESGLKSVRGRFLMSEGLTEPPLREALKRLQDNREALLAICRSKHLPKSASRNMTEFLSSFYEEISKSSTLPNKMEEH
jgi:hypothetical protein